MTTLTLVLISLNGKERLSCESEISLSHRSLNTTRTTIDFSTPQLNKNHITIVFLIRKREVLSQAQYSPRNGS